MQILGSLDRIETGVRQLIREEPLETMQVEYLGEQLTIPTEAEMLRIKGVLILQRNATRDYLDFVLKNGERWPAIGRWLCIASLAPAWHCGCDAGHCRVVSS